MPTKAQLKTVAFALVAIALINRVQAAEPIRKLING